MEMAVEVNNLGKSFGVVKAVEGVTLSVGSGEIYALIGPNGGGKTTLIKMMVGLFLPDAGWVKVFGHEVRLEPEKAKETFGYISDNPSAYDYLTGYEFLNLTGRLRGIANASLKKRIEELVNLFPILKIMDQPMSQYSRGNRQKVAFLAALLGKPKLLIIDEPIVGLDPASIKILGKELKKFAQEGGTVFFATHILPFASDYASRIGVMSQGKIIMEKAMGRGVKVEDLYQLAS